MTAKQYEIIAALILTAFIIGRYSAPEKIVTETKTVTVEVEKKDVEKEANQEKTVTEIKYPSGETVTRTKVRHDTVSLLKESNSDKVMTDDKKTVENNAGTSFSVMAGVKDWSLIYGISATKPILGPITLGIWGLSDASFGLQLGLRL